MPELPEIQTIVNDLSRKVLRQKIKQVEIRLPKIVKGSKRDFQTVLLGNSLQKVVRRGKYIVFQLAAGNKYLVAHLRLTGQIIYVRGGKITAGGHSIGHDSFDLPNPHTHLIIHFQDGSDLFYNDQRQFGFWQIADAAALRTLEDKLGIDPLSSDFTLPVFQKMLAGKKGSIKAFLLNQKHIAGIGNIYADESCFRAYILPSRAINTLTVAEIKKLHQAIRSVLRLAVKHRGTTFHDYVDAEGRQGEFVDFLYVYGREGEKCRRCRKGIIKKTKVAGRGTRYCPVCQK